MMNFCTYFDSYYILKGLALYDSLCNTCGDDFHLYICAFDDESYKKLNSLQLRNVTVDSLSEVETDALLKVKPTRTKAEYCWTCGPSVIYHILMKYQLSDITYLDSDLFFMTSPKVIFDEIGDNSIGITEHFFEKQSIEGRFCVQYVYFKNDDEGLDALTWWRDRCIEWCFCRYEDGKYGDQKYLEQFPVRYKKVSIITNRGVGIAPWNMNLYSYSDNTLTHQGIEYTFVFFHFHGVTTELIDYELTLRLRDVVIENKRVVDLFMLPYMDAIKQVYENYLEKSNLKTRFVEMSLVSRLWRQTKRMFRNNSIAQFFYYKVFSVRFGGREVKKL